MILNYATDIQAGTDPANFVYLGGQLVWKRTMPVVPTKISLIQLDESGQRTAEIFIFEDFASAKSYMQSENIHYFDMIVEGTELQEIPDGILGGANDLVNVDIQSKVTRIGSGAFSGCTSMKGIQFPDSVQSVGNGTFSGCVSLETIQFPQGFLSFGNGAFADCVALTEIVLPSSVATIPDTTFYGCSGITNITIRKPQDSISGAPWGAVNAVVTWTE